MLKTTIKDIKFSFDLFLGLSDTFLRIHGSLVKRHSAIVGVGIGTGLEKLSNCFSYPEIYRYTKTSYPLYKFLAVVRISRLLLGYKQRLA